MGLQIILSIFTSNKTNLDGQILIQLLHINVPEFSDNSIIKDFKSLPNKITLGHAVICIFLLKNYCSVKMYLWFILFKRLVTLLCSVKYHLHLGNEEIQITSKTIDHFSSYIKNIYNSSPYIIESLSKILCVSKPARICSTSFNVN